MPCRMAARCSVPSACSPRVRMSRGSNCSRFANWTRLRAKAARCTSTKSRVTWKAVGCRTYRSSCRATTIWCAGRRAPHLWRVRWRGRVGSNRVPRAMGCWWTWPAAKHRSSACSCCSKALIWCCACWMVLATTATRPSRKRAKCATRWPAAAAQAAAPQGPVCPTTRGTMSGSRCAAIARAR